jgi:hypothetical protein
MTEAVPAPPQCPRCGRRHRTWRTLAGCQLAPIAWVSGSDPWASVSDCPRGRTVQLYPTRDEAEAAKRFIDRYACGGVCLRWHRVLHLGGHAATRG